MNSLRYRPHFAWIGSALMPTASFMELFACAWRKTRLIVSIFHFSMSRMCHCPGARPALTTKAVIPTVIFWPNAA
jgi:hypothetical protein